MIFFNKKDNNDYMKEYFDFINKTFSDINNCNDSNNIDDYHFNSNNTINIKYGHSNLQVVFFLI